MAELWAGQCRAALRWEAFSSPPRRSIQMIPFRQSCVPAATVPLAGVCTPFGYPEPDTRRTATRKCFEDCTLAIEARSVAADIVCGILSG